MSLDDLVSLSITIESSALSLPGFGTALLLPAAHTHFSNRVKEYTKAADMLADGFLSSDQVYIDAVALMSQNPRPRSFKVGKRSAAVAQVDTLVLTAVNSFAYTVEIDDGQFSKQFTYTADSSATVAEVRDGLVTAINNGSLAVTAAASSNDVTLTADNAGIPFVATVSLHIVKTTTTPSVGLAEDIAAIVNYDDDWYCLLISQRDAVTILDSAKVIQGLSGRKINLVQSNDAAILTAAYNSSSHYDGTDATADVASNLKVKGYTRTALFYDATDADPLAAAVAGRCLAEIPGSINWAFKQLAGVTSIKLTSDQRANLLSKNANGYEPLAGKTMTYYGTVASGEYLDIITGIDKLYQRIQQLNAQSLLGTPKIPYTQAGLSIIAANVRTALTESTRSGLIAESRVNTAGKLEVPAFTVTAPSIGDIDSATRETRAIPSNNPVTFEATLQGAINVITISGTVSF